VLRTFDGHRLYHLMAGEDEREGGALLYFGLASPLEIAHATREVPSPMRFVEMARTAQPDVWIDVEKPFWWDVPVWLASGQVQSIGIANNHMCRDRMLANEAWGRPRDLERLPDPLGNGYWSQEIYYHLLNSGLRLPPSAGSASGVLPNPVGYNRVYVHVESPLTHDKWWRSLRRGNCFVTNGPLLLCRANGLLPGGVFTNEAKSELTIELNIELLGRDRVEWIEVIKNGEVVERLAVTGSLPMKGHTAIQFSSSGWFLVRAIADERETFRFASTGPYYVQLGDDRNHISRSSVEFFRRWVAERTTRVEENLRDDPQRDSVLTHHYRARDFWNRRYDMANAK
jgi:hypothetical protein